MGIFRGIKARSRMDHAHWGDAAGWNLHHIEAHMAYHLLDDCLGYSIGGGLGYCKLKLVYGRSSRGGIEIYYIGV